MNEADHTTADGSAGRRGRWRSGLASRRKILDAARARFAADGYQRATVRAISADAGVDPSMIHYFFGRKDQLFAAAMDMRSGTPREALTALLTDGVDDLGPRLVRRFLELWDATDQVEPFLALARSAHAHDQSAAMLREFIDRDFITPIVAQLDSTDTRLRASLISTQLFGLTIARYAVRLEPIASAHHDTLTAWLGPIVQNLLTGPAPTAHQPAPPAYRAR